MESQDNMPVLVVHDQSETGLAVKTAVKRLIGEMHDAGMTVLEADGYADGELMVRTHPERPHGRAGVLEVPGRPVVL